MKKQTAGRDRLGEQMIHTSRPVELQMDHLYY